MIRRPPRSTQSRSSAASDVYKRQRLARARDQTRRTPAQPGSGHLSRPASSARRAASGSTTVITRTHSLHPGSLPSGRGAGKGELVLQHPRSTALTTTLGGPTVRDHLGRHGAHQPDGTPAVSYTHLRAHETDSYLVCRLLLEKK